MQQGKTLNKVLFHVSATTVVVGLILISINVLGMVLNAGLVQKSSSKYRIPGYSFALQDTSAVKAMLEKPIPEFDPEIVNNAIFASIIHTDQRRIHFLENWLLWLAGRIHHPFLTTQNPERIVAGGGALCSEVAALFNGIASVNGYQTRLIELNQHVVTEIKTSGDWRVMDPDFGVSYPVGLDVLEKKESIPLLKQKLRERNFGEEKIDLYVSYFQTSEDNIVKAVGEPMSPRLYFIEKLSEWLKWLIPVVLIGVGMIRTKQPG